MSEKTTRFDMVKARHKRRLDDAIKNGEADELICGLCKLINSKKNFFTSSSCSGRIILLGIKGTGKKNAYFHRKWHSKVNFAEVWSALSEKTKGTIWFKMESFIIHIGALNKNDALKVLEIKNKAGIKRGGIISMKPGKIIVELIGTEDIAIPVKVGSKIIVSESFMHEAVNQANKKMEENLKRLKVFESAVKGGLK
ncbi:MAG: hypothetical protein N3F05_00315 [Candidatus Diapherotrites archaeon]|nr:hypothetical protein [Candidatus Diapherotrites archaeon]